MKKFILLFVITILLFSSCTSKEAKIREELRKPPQAVKFSNNEYSLKLERTIKAPLYGDISSSVYTYDILQDSLFYFAYNNNKLAVLHIKTDSIEKIDIPDYLITGGISSIEAVSKDSIFLTQNFPASILLLKIGESVEVEKYDLEKADISSNNELFNQMTSSGDRYDVNYNLDDNNLIYNTKTQQLHVGFQPIDYPTSSGMEDTPQVGVYNWVEKRWSGFYGSPYGYIKEKGDLSFGRSFLSKKQMIAKEDAVITTYRTNHTVGVYQGEKMIKEVPMPSKYSEAIFQPMTPEEADDFEETKEYANTTPMYFYTFYHKGLDLYSRIYLREQEAYDHEGLNMMHSDREVYIALYDKMFHHIGEIKFPKSHFTFELVPTSDGFLLFSNRYTDTDDASDNFFKLRFKYTIEKK